MSASFLQIHDVSFSYPGSAVTLFDGFSLEAHGGWIAVAGSNGTGKTTLLRLLAGSLSPDSGEIRLDGKPVPALRALSPDGISYCPQETRELSEQTLASFWSADNEARRLFSLLGVTAERLGRYGSLSGGEKKRIQIGLALAENPRLLLLDEPTNHLDGEGRELVLSALGRFPGMGIVVSHDRAFCDALCGRTLWLYTESGRIACGGDRVVFRLYSSSLSGAIELRQAEAESSRAEWSALDKKAGRERAAAERLQSEAERSLGRLQKKSLSDKNDHDARRRIDLARVSGKDRTAGDARARAASKLSRTEEKRDSVAKVLRRKEGFSVPCGDSAGNFRLLVEETRLSAGTYSLDVPRLELNAMSRVALTGRNGSGKTLFVRHLLSVAERQGKAGQILYLPQEITARDELLLMERFSALDEAQRGEVLSTLYRLGSEPEALNGRNRDVGSFRVSPGELRKLTIAMGINSPVSLLVLDEPTNHMDITSVLALEAALSGAECALLIVSHDPAFLGKVTSGEWHALREGRSGKIIAR